MSRSLAARDNGRLIGTNLLTRWGSFAFFGPLTILPEYWDRGIAQLLLDATVRVFDKQGLKRTALFTFAQSAKHVGLYQKFGYWPGYLTALMTKTPDSEAPTTGPAHRTVHLTALTRKRARTGNRGVCEAHQQDRQGSRPGQRISDAS